jgi:hypothetical protein
VVLVDGYDKPILDNLTHPELAIEMRDGCQGKVEMSGYRGCTLSGSCHLLAASLDSIHSISSSAFNPCGHFYLAKADITNLLLHFDRAYHSLHPSKASAAENPCDWPGRDDDSIRREGWRGGESPAPEQSPSFGEGM